MAGLFAPAVAITATRRRRFLWAAWWTAPPERVPFRKPDAAEGGARSREEARRAAEKAAGRVLVEIDGAWARAWARVLQGEDPWPAGAPREGGPRRVGGATARSAWEVLGLAAGASLEEVKRAYRARARATHPDHGGDAGEFREVKRAYESAVKKVAKKVKKVKTARKG